MGRQTVIPSHIQIICCLISHALDQAGIDEQPRVARKLRLLKHLDHAGVLLGRHIAKPQTFVGLVPSAIPTAMAEQIASRMLVGMFFDDTPHDPGRIQTEARVVVEINDPIVALKEKVWAKFGRRDRMAGPSP